MNVDVTIKPARDCGVGTEVLWPLHGDSVLWTIFDAHADGLCARSQQTKDVLVIPRADFPVPVVVNKHHANPYANQAWGAQQQRTHAQSFGNSGFGNAYGTSNV